MLVLIDLDNTLVDFDDGLRQAWRRLHPDRPGVSPDQRRNFHPHLDYPREDQANVRAICQQVGFVAGLQPMDGAVAAVRAMAAAGHDILLCSSYLDAPYPSAGEKYAWVERWLGSSYLERLILTRDKTCIRGDILIDDKPVITGRLQPVWEHILYDQPYNRHVCQRRLSWNSWQADVPELGAMAG